MKRKMNMLLISMMIFLIIGLSVNAITNEKETETDEIKSFYKYYTHYYIEHGDTLYGIAEKFMEEYPCTEEVWSQKEYAEAIADTNNLSSTKIIAGNHLVIPYLSEELK